VLPDRSVQHSWKQTQNLKLPIICVNCGKSKSSFAYYFGEDFMKGSVICVDKQGDKNNKSLIPFILDAIKTDGGDSLAE
jgi:hypothetical protein